MRAFIPQCVGKIGHYIAQYIVSASVLKTVMHRFVVRIALRQHAPLGTRIENLRNGF